MADGLAQTGPGMGGVEAPRTGDGVVGPGEYCLAALQTLPFFLPCTLNLASISAIPPLSAFILRAYGCFLDGGQGTPGPCVADGERALG